MERFSVFLPNSISEMVEEVSSLVAARVAMCKHNLETVLEVTVVGERETIMYHHASVDRSGFRFLYRTKRAFVIVREVWTVEMTPDFTKIDKTLFYDLLFSFSVSTIVPIRESVVLTFCSEAEAYHAKSRVSYVYGVETSEVRAAWRLQQSE